MFTPLFFEHTRCAKAVHKSVPFEDFGIFLAVCTQIRSFLLLSRQPSRLPAEKKVLPSSSIEQERNAYQKTGTSETRTVETSTTYQSVEGIYNTRPAGKLHKQQVSVVNATE